MKALVIHRAERADFAIYLYSEGAGGSRFGYVPGEDGNFKWVETPERGELPVSFRLPPEAMEALVKAAADALPVDAGMAAALDDTRAVRDRLLALVEQLATSRKR